MNIRIPTNWEYNKLVRITCGDDKKMHWSKIFSHVSDPENDYNLQIASHRAVRGYFSARNWFSNLAAANRYMHVGFRPAFDNINTDILTPDIEEGDIVTLCALYMDGTPVCVPRNPTCYGDIKDYIPGSELKIREIFNPHYQITGIYIGDGVVIADRVILKRVSCLDIEANIV